MFLEKKIVKMLRMIPEKSQNLSIDLSNEEFINYQSLGLLLKNTSFLDSLFLPKIKNENLDEFFKILNEITIENATLTQIKFNSFNLDNISEKNALIYQQIQSRLKRNKKRIFAIHGGGYIGLGLMADIISQSPYNYNIFATSNDKFLNLLINSINKFWIQHGPSREYDVTCIKNISMVYSRNSQNIKELYIHSNIMAICLTEEGVIQSAKHIAQGLIARYETDQAGLKIFVVMNKQDCANFVRTIIYQEIAKQTSVHYCELILKSIIFVPTMVDRIVTKIGTNIVLQQLGEQLNKNKINLINQNFIDRNTNFAKQIETILTSPKKILKIIKKLDLQFNLFKTELSFVLYAPEGLPEISRFPAIKSVQNLDQFILLKNKYVNGPHAVLAWLGGLLGYQTIAKASQDPFIINLIKNMMQYEIAPILQVENPSIKKDQLDFLKATFFNHCNNSNKDSILRVGRDPLRKLIRDGCITGVIDLCRKNKLSIPTTYLEYGICAGILYALKNIDSTNVECQTIRNIFKKSNSYVDILCYNGPYRNGYYPGLDKKQDLTLIQNLIKRIEHLDLLIYENINKYSPERKFTRIGNLVRTNLP